MLDDRIGPAFLVAMGLAFGGYGARELALAWRAGPFGKSDTSIPTWRSIAVSLDGRTRTARARVLRHHSGEDPPRRAPPVQAHYGIYRTPSPAAHGLPCPCSRGCNPALRRLADLNHGRRARRIGSQLIRRCQEGSGVGAPVL